VRFAQQARMKVCEKSSGLELLVLDSGIKEKDLALHLHLNGVC
jgi:hypothetical protein